MRLSTQAMHKTNAEIRRLAVTMTAPAIAEQLGVDRSTVNRLLGWRWAKPEPAIILPAPPEEVYLLMMARTMDQTTTIRRRIDLFCRAIPDRAFAKRYRHDLLAIHRTQPFRTASLRPRPGGAERERTAIHYPGFPDAGAGEPGA